MKYALKNSFGSLNAGAELVEYTDCSVIHEATGIVFCKEDENVSVIKEVAIQPVNGEAFFKVLDASQKDIADEKFVYDEQYLFYQISDNTWRKAKMERTSSDIGRLISGFTLSVDATPKQKFNRLTNLNNAYGLGLTVDQIREARDGVNS